MKSYAYGFPRLGENREFKKQIESFWKGEINAEAVTNALTAIQKDNIKGYSGKVDLFPDGEMSAYDAMLDAAILCGVYDPKSLKEYYELCRGANALEMTKWFNTNYHYLVPDFDGIDTPPFKINKNNIVLQFKSGNRPQLVGPFTLLKLSKGIEKENFSKFFISLMEVYKGIIAGYKNIQIDEPAFVLDLSKEEIELIKTGYRSLGQVHCEITLMTYYDSVDFIEDLISFPVSSIGLDFVRGEDNFNYIKSKGFPKDKTLIAGLVDGRNVWKNNIQESVSKLKALSSKVDRLMVSNAGPLYHLPISLSKETSMAQELKQNLSFAKEKLEEIRSIAEGFGGKNIPALAGMGHFGKNEEVRRKVSALTKPDFVKKTSLPDRRKIHDALLKLPLFPTTTIGSYPQTTEVRQKRAAFTKGDLSAADYKKYVHGEIDKLVETQEKLGLDVLVHGEFERTDMVEFFAQNLDGIATTQSGWIISYGTRAYRPPIIFGDVSRPKPMTVDEIRHAQSKTKKPVKGMLTGAVTIIAWSFCREDVAVSEVAYQIGLALKDEIIDYEKAGIKVVQVDEAAFREKAPIKKKNWPQYFDWAVKSFNLTTNTDPKTQIHTHMCYSEFGEIIDSINQMDFDVISIEASRSKGDIIQYFENVDFKRQIGLGVWDIHSPAVPSPDKMIDIVNRSLQKIPKENFWLNPDCGLKTRQWPEVKEALAHMVTATNKLRSYRTAPASLK
jgi:5-methyltetrahydropteroyltriglutamate--homocysteine methyltransferase